MSHPEPGADIFKQVKAGAEAIDRARELNAEYDATLESLIAEGEKARSRVLKVLPGLPGAPSSA